MTRPDQTPPPMDEQEWKDIEMKLRPLEWVEARVSDRWERYSAMSMFGSYEALEWSNGGFGGTLAPRPPEEDGVEFSANSIEEAKAKCEADYRDRIMSAFE